MTELTEHAIDAMERRNDAADRVSTFDETAALSNLLDQAIIDIHVLINEVRRLRKVVDR
jgi:hypothetical protein